MASLAIDMEQQRWRLLEERERLQRELAAYGVSGSLSSGSDLSAWDNASLGNHLADDATEVFEQEKNLTLERNLRQMLEEVNYALAKLDEGTYGVCEACGRPIAPERLEALPHATLCIACKARAERSRSHVRWGEPPGNPPVGRP